MIYLFLREILNNEPYGEKIDCWSFGCVLYSLVCGQAPFEVSNFFNNNNTNFSNFCLKRLKLYKKRFKI